MKLRTQNLNLTQQGPCGTLGRKCNRSARYFGCVKNCCQGLSTLGKCCVAPALVSVASVFVTPLVTLAQFLISGSGASLVTPLYNVGACLGTALAVLYASVLNTQHCRGGRPGGGKASHFDFNFRLQSGAVGFVTKSIVLATFVWPLFHICSF